MAYTKNNVVFDDEAKGLYLETLIETGLPLTAAHRIGVPKRIVNSTRDIDPEFDEAYNDALELFAERVEEELIRRAMYGVQEDIFKDGEIVGQVTKYSDALMTLLIKTKNPKYNEKKQTDVTITGGVLLTAAPAPSMENWLASGEIPKELPPLDVAALPAGPPPQVPHEKLPQPEEVVVSDAPSRRQSIFDVVATDEDLT